MSDFKNIVQISKEIVADYENAYSTDPISPEEVYVVWYSKTLKNVKLMLSTPTSNGMYYESTYNGDTNELYFDAYVKKFNTSVSVEEREL